MERLLSNREMRAADAYTIGALGVSSEALMGRAGRAIALETAKAAKELGIKDILVVCGAGNNGGDGYVCASDLLRRGIAVEVFALGGTLSADCSREKSRYSGGYADTISDSAEIIVDCIFGTGLSRDVEGEFAEAISKINACGAFVISADIPSGINGDNGLVCGCAVKADLTVAVAELKAGFYLSDGPDHCGKVVVKDIGITLPDQKVQYIFENSDISILYPKRKRNSNKGTYGTAQLVAGSKIYKGAAALSLQTALQSGCGYVKLCAPAEVADVLAPRFPQVIYNSEPDQTADCIAVGMGCSVSEELYELIKGLLQTYGGTLLIDADGLNSLARYGVGVLKSKKNRTVILTPHIKEFSRLTGKKVQYILQNPIKTAEEFASEYGVTLLLKSSSSVLSDGARTAILHRGNSALAKGGSGDMLSGLAAGNVARGLSAFEAVACASYVVGVSAELSSRQKTEYCVTAKDIIKNLHVAVKCLTAP